MSGLESMTDAGLKVELDRTSAALNKAREDYKIIFGKMTPLYNKVNKLQELIDERKIKSMKKDDWNYILSCNNDGDTQARLRHRFESLRKIGLGSSGYVLDTNQAMIQITVSREDKKYNQKIVKGLKKILPYIKPIKNEKGIPIDIFEHTLSQDGIYEVSINKETQKCRLTVTICGRTKEIKRFKTIKDMVDYLAIYHYYE